MFAISKIRLTLSMTLCTILSACNLYSTNYDGQCHADKNRITRLTAICAVITAQRVGDPALSQGDARNQLALTYYGCAGLVGIPDDNKTGKCDGHFWSVR